MEVTHCTLQGGKGAEKENEGKDVNVCTVVFALHRRCKSISRPVTSLGPAQDVLSEHPTYIDCYLRLACMARARGSHKEALQYAQVGPGVGRRRV